MMNKSRILVVSPEYQTRHFLRVNLELLGYDIQEMETGQESLLNITHLQPDLIILDRNLPDMDGLDVLQRLHQRVRSPILVLLSHDCSEDKIAVAEAGADDYYVKPFPINEMIARMNVLFQHMYPQAQETIFTTGELEVDLSNRRVSVQGQPVKLTGTEYALLRFMVRHAGKALTHRQILKSLWGERSADKTHYLRVYMARLRQKLERDPNKPRVLLTENGVGYRLLLKGLILFLILYHQFSDYLEPLITISTDVLR